MAKRAKVPIIPVTILGTGRMMPSKKDSLSFIIGKPRHSRRSTRLETQLGKSQRLAKVGVCDMNLSRSRVGERGLWTDCSMAACSK